MCLINGMDLYGERFSVSIELPICLRFMFFDSICFWSYGCIYGVPVRKRYYNLMMESLFQKIQKKRLQCIYQCIYQCLAMTTAFQRYVMKGLRFSLPNKQNWQTIMFWQKGCLNCCHTQNLSSYTENWPWCLGQEIVTDTDY